MSPPPLQEVPANHNMSMRVLKKYSGHLNAQCKDFAEADPGFPIGGGANPPGGRQHMILPNFAKNCMKLRKIWAVRGARAGAASPQNPPLLCLLEVCVMMPAATRLKIRNSRTDFTLKCFLCV